MFGKGVMITWLERRRDGRVDLNRFLIELTQLADQDDLGLQLSLQNNDIEMNRNFSVMASMSWKMLSIYRWNGYLSMA